jgi:hypothetical protein
MMGSRKGSLDRVGIAHAHRKGGVVGGAIVHHRRAAAHGVLGAHDRGENVVIDRDELRRVARLGFGRGDDDGNAFADIAHAILCQRWTLGAEAFGPAHILGHHLGIECAKLVPRPVLTGEDRKHSWRCLCRGLVHAANASMRMRREDKDSVRLANHIDIRNIASTPGQKAGILLACDRLSDPKPHDPAPEFAPSLHQAAHRVDAPV